MSNDIEALLRHADAPVMGVSAQEIIAGAQRTRRRRRARYAAYGLAAALVIGLGVGADRVVANRAQLLPATQSTTGPLGALFTLAIPDDNTFDGYAVGGTADHLTLSGGSGHARRTSHLDGGVTVFQDGQHTIAVTPLPRDTDRASAVYTGGTAVASGGVGLRMNGDLTVQISVTENPATVRGVIWATGSHYYSTTGEHAQVATFGTTSVFWYRQLDVYGMDHPDGSTTQYGALTSGYLDESDGPEGNLTSRFATTVPHGARDVSAQTAKGDTASPPQVRRLGTTSYDVVYVTALPKSSNSYTPLVQSISWTDGSGRHTRSYS